MRYTYKDICFVTGASSNHFRSLCQLLSSIVRHYPDNTIIVFDLGLNGDQSHFVKFTFPTISFNAFDYSKYPSYFNININAGEYAWKPICVKHAAMRFNKPVLWLDAGDVITANINDGIIKAILTRGFYTSKTEGDLAMWTHPKTLDYLQIVNRNMPMGNGAIIGIDPNHPFGKRILDEWAAMALVKECIAPEGSSRANHRQDQAVLSCIASKVLGLSYPSYVAMTTPGISVHQDID